MTNSSTFLKYMMDTKDFVTHSQKHIYAGKELERHRHVDFKLELWKIFFTSMFSCCSVHLHSTKVEDPAEINSRLRVD